MTFNWGTGIAIFFSLFVISLVSQVIMSTRYGHSLVVNKYYEEDLQYQQHYDKLLNNQQLEQDLIIQTNQPKGQVLFAFPSNFREISGQVLFFRPADQSKDFRIPIQVDEQNQLLHPIGNLTPGLWKIKVDWQGNKTPYYKEITINI